MKSVLSQNLVSRWREGVGRMLGMSDRRDVMAMRLGKDTEENPEKRHLLWVKKTQVCEMVKIQSRSKSIKSK